MLDTGLPCTKPGWALPRKTPGHKAQLEKEEARVRGEGKRGQVEG